MHIEGNVGKALIKAFYGEKDTNFREACEELEMHPDVWVTVDPITRAELRPPAPWVLTPSQRREFRNRIGEMRFPTGYGANLRQAFGKEDNHKWPRYLKTHDYHHLLQHVLPVAIMGLASEEVEKALWSLGKLLRWICSKEIYEEEIPGMRILAAEVVCKLEKALPPSFFDCQVHLLVHLVDEVAICGLVHCRWMYWLERYMAELKSYVRNRARVEGSMATGYLALESAFYCSNILATIDRTCSHTWMEERPVEEDRLTRATKTRMLEPMELTQLTTFMLSNSTIMEEWRDFYEEAKRTSQRPRIFPKYHVYMKEKLVEVDEMEARGESVSHFPSITDDVRTIVHGPLRVVTTRTAMWTQGQHFRISSLDEKRGRTFDCGVQGQFSQDSRSSRHDRNIVRDVVPHYGKIEEILVVSYDAHSKFEEYVFKCKWFKVNLAGANRTVLQDECGHTRLKTLATSFQLSHWQTSKPFCFPSHVEQCFYIPYPLDPEEWSLVITYVPRSCSIVGEKPEIMVVSTPNEDEDQV
ncbi:unnamed protein product [Calypogeia fissa]